MQKSEINKLKLPDAPGVYFFLDSNKKILYIGKATSLQNRVRSYFSDDLVEKRSQLIAKMVREAVMLDWTETDSVLEALILETNLIRTHRPIYNTRSKDDKSYNHLIITNEEWPRVLTVRGKDLSEKFASKEIKYQFGPFPSGQLLRDALKIVRKLFQFYDTKNPIQNAHSKLTRGMIDFNRQIGLYPQHTDKREYDKTIRHIRLFFQGKKKQVIKELHRDMMQEAKLERFEEAERLRKKIFALEHIQDVSLLKKANLETLDRSLYRIEAYDIAHHSGQQMVGVMTVVENGRTVPQEYRKFKIKTQTDSNDPAALAEILRRRLEHQDWKLPDLLVVDGGRAQKNAIQKVLREKGINIPVVAVIKNKQHKPERLEGDAKSIARYQYDILLANAESHRFAINYHRSLARKKLTGK